MEQRGPILVTGGSGFVGQHLIWRLLRSGCGVTSVSRSGTKGDPNPGGSEFGGRLDVLRGDLRDRQWVLDRLGGTHWSVVYHLAGVLPDARTPSVDVIEGNLGTTQSVLELCAAARIERCIFTSTKSVYPYRNPDYNPVDEEHEIAPPELYGAAKYAAEVLSRGYAEQFGFPMAVLRCTGIYGRGRDRGALARVVRSALRGEDVRLESESGREFDMVHVSDVVEALLLASRADIPGYRVYNVGAGECRPLEWYARFILDEIGGASRLDLRLREGGAACTLDISRARNELGYSPAPLRQRLVEYIREMGGTK